MEIHPKIKSIIKNFSGLCISAYQAYSVALNDCARMCDAQNKVLSVSSGAFCRCFNDVARQISYARANKSSDTYCELAEKAVELLASGKSEVETLYYFDKMLRKEIEGE